MARRPKEPNAVASAAEPPVKDLRRYQIRREVKPEDNGYLTRGHEDSAREALQSAMVRVVKHVRRCESEQTFWSWLTVLARTALVDQERKRSRYNAALDRFAHEDSSAAETHLLECLRQSVATLQPDELAMIEKKYFEQQSIAQIASAMGITEKAVESRLVRIRQKLKKQTLELLK